MTIQASLQGSGGGPKSVATDVLVQGSFPSKTQSSSSPIQVRDPSKGKMPSGSEKTLDPRVFPSFKSLLSPYHHDELDLRVLSVLSPFVSLTERLVFTNFNPLQEKLAQEITPTQIRDVINTHMIRAVVLHHDQQVEYELCVMQADGLDKKELFLEEKCDTLQNKLDDIEKDKIQYKEMSERVENYASMEATLLVERTPRTQCMLRQIMEPQKKLRILYHHLKDRLACYNIN